VDAWPNTTFWPPIAIVDDPSRSEMQELLRQAALKRRHRLEHFADQDQAIAWLEKKS
jgi:hypothetical protein